FFYFCQIVVLGPKKGANRQPWKCDSRHVTDGSKGCFENQRQTGFPHGDFRRHPSAKRLPKNNNFIRLDFFSRTKIRQSRHSVFVGGLFRRLALAFSVTSIIVNEDENFKLVVKELKVFRAMADVAPITMKPEKGRRRA